MSILSARYFRPGLLLWFGMTGCMSNKLIYSEGNPSIIGDDCRAKRIKYADHITVTCKDHSTYEGQFLGTDCRHDSEVLLLSKSTSKPGGQNPDTQRVAVSSVAEIRYAKADYAATGAVVILGCVGVALMIRLAGGGSWLTIPD